MKKLTILLALLVVGMTANAQSYRINKKNYDPDNYVYQFGDRYNPAVAGVCSFFIPGLGQLVAGDPGRGAGLFATHVGFGIIFYISAKNAVKVHIDKDTEWVHYAIPNKETVTFQPSAFFYLSAMGMFTTWIYSIADAVNVAKVNNMAWRDKVKVSFNPYYVPEKGFIPSIGIKINF